jgi:hypothetical protein
MRGHPGERSGAAVTALSVLGDLEQRGATPEQAAAYFDSRPAVAIEAMLGSWRGTAIATGHPLEGLLERYGWYGKRFESAEAVHPLVMGSPGGSYCLDPALLSFDFARRFPALVRAPLVVGVARLGFRLMATTRPKARLRMMTFRGVSSATMVYDAHPILDVFRRVDDDAVIGAMDMRGDAMPGLFYFSLRREA